MKTLIRSIAFSLMLSVTYTTTLQVAAQASLVPANVAVSQSQYNRAADMASIQKSLESKLIRKKLQSLGLSEQEIRTRLDRLSDQEVHQLASQIHSVQPAGDAIVYILVIVVLVLLAIYLIKRV
jgi:hypothetical protein